MPIDSFLFTALQGDEADLQARLSIFLNSIPKKKILNISTWVVGVEVYMLLIYEYDSRGRN